MTALGGVATGAVLSRAGSAPSAIALGIGLGMFTRTATSAVVDVDADWTPPALLTQINGLDATLELALVPSSIQVSGATVTQWSDVSGNARHHTPTGSPQIDTTGLVSGVNLDGSNDRLDWNGTGFDDKCTIFVVHKVVSYPSLGAYSGIFEISDTTGSDRSIWLHAYGSSDTIGARRGDGNGAVSYTSGGTDVMVSRIDSTDLAWALRKNGVAKGSSGYPKTPRTVTRSRIGNRIAGDVSYHRGVVYAVIVYSGELDDDSILTVENKLLVWAGASQPFDWSDVPNATVTTGDPRIITPAAMPTYSGMLRLEHDSVRYRNGKHTLTVGSGDSLYVSSSPAGRTVLMTSGGCSFTVTEGVYSQTTTITDYEITAVPKKYVLGFGNSNMHRMQSGLLQYIYSLMGSSLVGFVGTVAAPSGFNCPAEGRDSWVMSATANALGASGAFDAAGSPFYVGGGALNMAGYEALLSHAPTHVMMSCLQNAAYLSSEGALEATLAAEKTASLNIFAAMEAQWPGIVIGIMNEWPLRADPSGGWGSWSQRDLYHRKMHRAAEVAQEIATAAVGLGIDCSVIHTYPHVGIGTRPLDPWADDIHISAYGHQQLIPPVLGWILAH